MFSIYKVKEALALQHSIVMNLLLFINREQKKKPSILKKPQTKGILMCFNGNK